MNMQDKIFTFWADKDKMPEYIKMCIESWKKHLPDYEIVILDYLKAPTQLKLILSNQK